MVKGIRDGEGGWPSDPQTLKARVLKAWEDIPLESFRELVRSYRVRLEAIHSVDGNRHRSGLGTSYILLKIFE